MSCVHGVTPRHFVNVVNSRIARYQIKLINPEKAIHQINSINQINEIYSTI